MLNSTNLPILRGASARGGRLLAVGLVLLALAACSAIATARTTEWTYVLDGKTYVLQELNYTDQRNFTLFEVVDGERQFTALYDPGDGPAVNLSKDPIPPDGGHLTTIMTVVQRGEQQGEAQTSSQRSLDPTRVFDPDFGD